VRPIEILECPYDSGHRGERFGAGPTRLVTAGAAERGSATVTGIGVDVDFATEAGVAVAVMREVQRGAASALDRGAAPLLLSGNCGSMIGVVAAHAAVGRRVGVLWLDAHGDLHTPATTGSGFFDGMGLAMLTGRCWETLARSIDGFAPLDDSAVVLVGGHQLDPDERDLIAASALTHLGPEALRSDEDALSSVLARLSASVDGIHLHIDLDVHDIGEGAANSYAAAGGLTAADVRAVVTRAAGALPVVSASIASWDPALDADGRMERIALDLVADLSTALGYASSTSPAV
jgi:arginase